MTVLPSDIPTVSRGALPGPDTLVFVPLGGAGEIGMNLYLYGFGGKWLMVDLGISFADETIPGVEIVMADPAFIVERRDDLLGIVVTHAHEDHVGAIPYLWPRLGCPIYATPFAASIIRRKVAEAGLRPAPKLVELPQSGSVRLGPFGLELITVTHSIPEPNAVIIRTEIGTVLHTGDWKLDPAPLVGPLFDEAAFRRLGEEGVCAIIADSTNALEPGSSGSEADLEQSLSNLVGQCRRRVALTCFATNVARLKTATAVAAKHGRQVALVGRSLWRINEAAREHGYLDGVPPFLNEQEAAQLPPDQVMLIVSGSQGEPRSALSRIAAGDHQNIALEKGDVVIFSSRIIPGNERAIGRVYNQLARLGVEVVTERDHLVHVSGHPAQDELAQMYAWVRPQAVVPVHGEWRHLASHAEFARQCGVPNAVVIENGAVVRLAPGEVAVVGAVPTGVLALDGNRLVPHDSAHIRGRQRMVNNGTAVITVVIDAAGRLSADPQVSVQGLLDPDSDHDMRQDLVDAVRTAVQDLRPEERARDEAVSDAVRTAVRRRLRDDRGKRPVTDVHLVRV